MESATPYLPLQMHSAQVFIFTPQPHDISFRDDVLDAVKDAWRAIQGAEAEAASFLRFEEREPEVDD